MNNTTIFFLVMINLSYSLFATKKTLPCNNQSTASKSNHEFLGEKNHDGFCAGTLVKTPSGYKPIETLRIGDCILDAHNQPKKIEAMVLRCVPHYWTIKINDEQVGFGTHQLFHTQSSNCQLITETDNITTTQDSFRNIYNIEFVENSTCLHAITVEDHLFCVTTHDLIVHNAEAVALGTLSIALENFSISSAVISTIQATIPLVTISYQALKNYYSQQEAFDDDDFDENKLCQKARTAEQEYFGKRKQELENIYNEFLTIKNGLLSISGTYNRGINFTSLFFKEQTFLHITNAADLILMNEMHLSEDQYEKLRTARDMYLNMIEEEIDNLHLMIALHLNEVIENVKQAQEDHSQTKVVTKKFIDEWDIMRQEGEIPINIGLLHYEHDLYDYYSLQKAQNRLEELKVIFKFYQSQLAKPYLIQTIPIQELLKKTPSFIRENEEWMNQEHKRIVRNIEIDERYFTDNGIYPNRVFPQIQTTFERQYEEKRKTRLFELKKRQEKFKQKYKDSKKSKDKKNNDNKNDEPEKPRCTVKYASMKEVFKKAPIGKILEAALVKTTRLFENYCIMYRAIKDIVEFGIQKGDWLYLDKKHYDHIEVFDKLGRTLRTILNMDGTRNQDKINLAKTRDIIDWI